MGPDIDIQWAIGAVAFLLTDTTRSVEEGSLSRAVSLFKKAALKLVRMVYEKEENLLLTAPLRYETTHVGVLGCHFSDSDAEFLQEVKKQFPHKYPLFQRRLAQKLYCERMYTDEKELVAYTWVATEEYHEPKLRHTFRLPPGQIYQFDGFLKPDFRKGMMASIGLTGLWNHFVEKGYTATLAVVNKENAANLKWHAFMGFEETGEKIVTRYLCRIPFSVQQSYPERYFRVRRSRRREEGHRVGLREE